MLSAGLTRMQVVSNEPLYLNLRKHVARDVAAKRPNTYSLSRIPGAKKRRKKSSAIFAGIAPIPE